VIYNAVNVEEIGRRVQSAKHSPRRRPYLFTIGQLSPHKNLPNLIRAFDLLARESTELDLVIGGQNYSHAGYANELLALATERQRIVFCRQAI